MKQINTGYIGDVLEWRIFVCDEFPIYDLDSFWIIFMFNMDDPSTLTYLEPLIENFNHCKSVLVGSMKDGNNKSCNYQLIRKEAMEIAAKYSMNDFIEIRYHFLK